jgi:hypothetical protein
VTSVTVYPFQRIEAVHPSLASNDLADTRWALGAEKIAVVLPPCDLSRTGERCLRYCQLQQRHQHFGMYPRFPAHTTAAIRLHCNDICMMLKTLLTRIRSNSFGSFTRRDESSQSVLSFHDKKRDSRYASVAGREYSGIAVQRSPGNRLSARGGLYQYSAPSAL